MISPRKLFVQCGVFHDFTGKFKELNSRALKKKSQYNRRSTIFLDDDAVEQTDALVVPVAYRHRVFLRHAQAGQRLAHVHDSCLESCYRIHIAPCKRGRGG